MDNNNYAHSQLLHKGYEIFGKIASGGMSEVFSGRNYYLTRFKNSTLAIKRLKSEFLECDTALYSFETEFIITQKLAHENIIKIHDFVVSKRDVFLVMDLLEGATFNKINFFTNFSKLEDKLNIVLQIIKALAFIHSNSVIHGDIKPSNIFLSFAGSIKIIDFGLSVGEGRAPSNAAYAVSLKYSSPERLRDGNISYKDDVYALGCIIHEVLLGCHPSHNFSSLDAKGRIAHERMIDSLDVKLLKIMDNMLSINPDNRPENAHQLLSVFSQIL